MDLQLKGKRALVTGSSSGIGAAIAHELAAEGVAVVIHGRDAAKAEAVASEVLRHGVKASIALGDLTRDAEADAVADAATAALGGIDILVSSAVGVVRSDNPDWLDVSPDEWLASFNLNVVSMVRLAKRLGPAMAERGWGRIINISSIGGSRYSGRLHDYGSAKAALEHRASREEVLEALGMAIYMGAGPAVMYAIHAIEAYDQLGAAKRVQAAG